MVQQGGRGACLCAALAHRGSFAFLIVANGGAEEKVTSIICLYRLFLILSCLTSETKILNDKSYGTVQMPAENLEAKFIKAARGNLPLSHSLSAHRSTWVALTAEPHSQCCPKAQ